MKQRSKYLDGFIGKPLLNDQEVKQFWIERLINAGFFQRKDIAGNTFFYHPGTKNKCIVVNLNDPKEIIAIKLDAARTINLMEISHG